MLFLQEAHLNVEPRYIIGESDVYESFTDDPGELFRACQRDHGRCTGKVYIDGADGQPIHVGWVFVKRKQYQDCNDTYLHETWVTVREKPDTVTRTRHYHHLN